MTSKSMRTMCLVSLLLGGVTGWSLKANKPVKHEYVYVKPSVDIDNISIDDPKLIKAIIKVESNGNPKAVSNKKAYGLMQVHYASWKKQLRQFGIHSHNDLFNEEKNLLAGKYVLARHYEEEKGNLRKTLQKYSGGAVGYFEKVMYNYFMDEEWK